MPWIESHSTLGRHPKTMRLARLLNVSVPCAIGHLHLLWWWALDYAADGELAAFDAAEIAEACQWRGDPEALMAAAREARFLDGDGHIHDWEQYAGKYVLRRREDAARKQTERQRVRPQGTADDDYGRPTDIRRTSDGHRQDGVRSPYVEERRGEERRGEDQTRSTPQGNEEGVQGEPKRPIAPAAPDALLASERLESVPVPPETVPAAAVRGADASITPGMGLSVVRSDQPAAAPLVRAIPKSNKLAEFTDLLRAANLPYVPGPPDGRALKGTPLSAAQVAGCYTALACGEFGDDWQREHLSAATAIRAYNAWQTSRQVPLTARIRAPTPPLGRVTAVQRIAEKLAAIRAAEDQEREQEQRQDGQTGAADGRDDSGSNGSRNGAASVFGLLGVPGGHGSVTGQLSVPRRGGG